jgi:hypothetical protein
MGIGRADPLGREPEGPEPDWYQIADAIWLAAVTTAAGGPPGTQGRSGARGTVVPETAAADREFPAGAETALPPPGVVLAPGATDGDAARSSIRGSAV